jgi:SAM-dependent methyltransferase
MVVCSKEIVVVGQRKTSIQRSHANQCLRDFCGNLGAKAVLNIGARPSASDKEGEIYEAYFPHAEFHTFDLVSYDHPRHRQGNLMLPPADLGTFDLVLAMSVIEHIDRPWVAAPKISKLVNPGGHLFIAMPWMYPIHEGPCFGDHWRSTPSGMVLLFDELVEVRRDYAPSSIVAVADRPAYWNDPNSAACGFCMLMHRPC